MSIPTQLLVCITGVSGSGKSTLIKQTLFAGYQREKGESLELDMAPFSELKGLDQFSDVVMVDQSPPGRSARSNPVTYIKAYDDIRALFANTRRAKTLGVNASHFSFNSPGGRCETCEGLGTVTIDMQFMADVTMVCNDCKGKRFTPLVLSVEYDGKTIDDVLGMTVDEAALFFKSTTRLTNKLNVLQDLGLGYLGLGQSTSTLSGGEAQRLKLASYLKSSKRTSATNKPYLFLFDEPTTGLHLGDIERLVEVFRHLVREGHSLIVIEHNIDFIAQADYIIDMGPEGGDGGGRLIAQGRVADIIEAPESLTGQALKERFNLVTSGKSKKTVQV